MTLYLEEGAKLLGSDSVGDFPIKGYLFEGLDQLVLEIQKIWLLRV